VALAAGVHRLGPDNASLHVKTYREGLAAKVGHDLVIEVTRWEATVELAESKVELSADARSLEVREGVRGVKPLTEKDRSEIRKNIDDVVLQGQPIAFRSRDVRLADGDGPLVVEGDLTMAGTTHAAAVVAHRLRAVRAHRSGVPCCGPHAANLFAVILASRRSAALCALAASSGVQPFSTVLGAAP
jgi:polyisoprenoid-binding protein YceI